MKKNNRNSKKLSLEISEDFGSSPFESIEIQGLPLPDNRETRRDQNKTDLRKDFGSKIKEDEKIGQGERLEIRREKSGRGGKTVTTIQGFPMSLTSKYKSDLLKKMKVSMGTGGTWNENTMELQGDKRREVMKWLGMIGYQPILAGG